MLPGRREWDVTLLRGLLYPHDVSEVLKIRLSKRALEDRIAWMYEKTGMFSVRSAYHLAVHLEAMEQDQMSTSAHADGGRPVYQAIWSAAVPPKVKVFTWRLSQEGLATQANRKAQKLENKATCQVCGKEEESGYHAVVRCTQATALQQEMRQHWILLDERKFEYTGPDWILHLLNTTESKERNNIILLLWRRAWHHRNDIMHGKGKCGLCGFPN
jgi:hypothetical protein